ncbi:unnamed protein product [Lactuca virosa]|uniref:Secreted protein n=1 Tax=Lactuca virosa TaxID=75947 RepID=A0AAU9PTY4_9ASTR|nr:unnamed protein product [Lactuca virosa]
MRFTLSLPLPIGVVPSLAHLLHLRKLHSHLHLRRSSLLPPPTDAFSTSVQRCLSELRPPSVNHNKSWLAIVFKFLN